LTPRPPPPPKNPIFKIPQGETPHQKKKNNKKKKNDNDYDDEDGNGYKIAGDGDDYD